LRLPFLFMKRLFIFYLLISSNISYSQLRDMNWCFGDSAGINFASGTPIPISSGMDGRGSCSSISDSSGNLLFYTSSTNYPLWFSGYSNVGCVYNKANQIMFGGDSLVSHQGYQEHVIIPFPGNSNLFYLFHVGVFANYGLYYSLIDMTQDGGMGAVTQKNIQIDSLAPIDGINVIKHANGRDWWLLFRNWQVHNNDYYLYLITPDSIFSHSIQSVGDTNLTNESFIQFNQSGNQILVVSWKGIIELLNFDRCTGLMTLNKVIEHEAVNYPYYFGCEFSPNGRFAYVVSADYANGMSNNSHLYQYDLNLPNPASFRDTLYTFNLPESPGELKLAPDNNIYITSTFENFIIDYPYPDSLRNYINENLSVINSPDSFSMACNFQPFSFYLGGKRTYWGLPNNPNYDLGPVSGSICDSLGLGIEIVEYARQGSIVVFPNPFYNKVSFHPLSSSAEKISIIVFNNVGEEVFEKITTLNDQEIDLSKLIKGVYFLNVKNEKISVTKKIVKL
jgi:hypothetical protein